MDEVEGRLELARTELSDLQQTIRHYDTILLQLKSWAITTAVAAGGFALNLTRPGIAMLGTACDRCLLSDRRRLQNLSRKDCRTFA